MNRAILMGRLTRDPEVRYSQGEKAMAITNYTLTEEGAGIRIAMNRRLILLTASHLTKQENLQKNIFGRA